MDTRSKRHRQEAALHTLVRRTVSNSSLSRKERSSFSTFPVHCKTLQRALADIKYRNTLVSSWFLAEYVLQELSSYFFPALFLKMTNFVKITRELLHALGNKLNIIGTLPMIWTIYIRPKKLMRVRRWDWAHTPIFYAT